MAVLVYVETDNGAPKKNALEAASYGSKLAAKSGDTCIAVALGSADDGALAGLGAYGVSKVLKVEDSRLDSFDARAYAQAIAETAKANGASSVIISHSLTGKSVAPIVAIKLEAGLVSGAVDVPNTDAGFVVKKAAFSGKAFAHVKVTTANKVVAIVPNSVGAEETGGAWQW